MNLKNKIIIGFKTFIYFYLLIYCLAAADSSSGFFSFIAIIFLAFLFAEFIIKTLNSRKKKTFNLTTEYGIVKISETVIENIISVILRKYKIIKHYVCAIYNEDDKLVISLNVETSLKKSDLLPLIFDTLKSNIQESIENTVCITKADTIEIIVDKIKRMKK